MRNRGYDLPYWVGKTSYRCNYTPNWDFYLPYPGWQIDSHMKISRVPVSNDGLSHILSSLSFSSSTLPSLKNTKLSHPSLSLNAIMKRSHRVEHTSSTAYTEYSILRVQQTLTTAYTVFWIIPTSTVSRSQPVFRHTMLYSILYIRTIKSQSMNRVSASLAPPSRTTASRLTAIEYSSNLA